MTTTAAEFADKIFSGASDPKLPSNVADRSLAVRRQFVGAWNGRFRDCRSDGADVQECESSAFAVANAAIKDLSDEEAEKFVYIDSWEVVENQVAQEAAEYNPVGGTDERACANCQWFISPNKCVIVKSDPEPITPNGLSNLWRARVRPQMEPIPVIIVEGSSHIDDDDNDNDNDKGTKQQTKTEGGVSFPASDFAVVPDRETPSTWKLRLAETSPGNVTVAQVARAITAMQSGGFRGNRVQLTADEKATAISRISRAIGKTGGTDDQKANLRDRLDAVKSITVEVPKGMLQKALDAVLGILPLSKEEVNTSAPDQRPFMIFKDSKGDFRWFAWASNRWRDRDNPPEIIEDKAHQDFVAYLDAGGRMPAAWLWHTPGTKWGTADWVDYDDGFLMVSGTVDPGMESIAEALALEKDLGVSHGFRYRHSDPDGGIIGWYRSFEVSPLPVKAAANLWTSMEVIAKEIDKAMNPTKRNWLVEKLGEAKVAEIEGDTKTMMAALEAAGVDTKDMPPNEEPSTAPAVLSEEQMKSLAEETGKAAVKALTESDSFKGILTTVGELQETNKGILERLDGLEKTDDEKIAAAVTGRRKVNGHVASQSDGSVVTGKVKEDAEAALVGPTIFDRVMEEFENEPASH